MGEGLFLCVACAVEVFEGSVGDSLLGDLVVWSEAFVVKFAHGVDRTLHFFS